MTTTTATNRAIASLQLPKQVPTLINLAKGIIQSMTGNGPFPTPEPTDGGKTWVEVPATLQAKTTVTGLTPGATVSFRYRPVTKVGVQDWSQPTSIIVK